MSVVRRASLHDLPGLYRVCLQTGDSGRDATPLYRNPDLLGHAYVGPYVIGQPELAFVVADPVGVAGYVVGAEHTAKFEAWAEEQWWPLLREQYPASDGNSADDEIIRLIHTRRPAAEELVARYPAHLHIDLLERVRGRGLGRALMERLLVSLKERGCPGVHLGVAKANATAVGFYRHLGFHVLEERPAALLMAMKLP